VSTEFRLSHFSLHAPNEGLAYWFVSHDFAEALKLEYSKDAASQLKQALGDSNVRVDYEADAVTLRIKRNEDVIPALRSVYEAAGWDPAELGQIEHSVLTFKRPRPKKIAAGDTFLIPIGNDTFGLGQVLEVSYKAPTVAVFHCVGPAHEIEVKDPTTLKPLSILHLGLGCSLLTGKWRVVSSYPVTHSPAAGTSGDRDSIGAISFGGDGPVVDLLRADAGLDAWEKGAGDPNYLRKFVLR